jgi:hypothetical protein
MILSTTYFAVDFFDDPCNQRGMKSEREFRERERERERETDRQREKETEREREREREKERFSRFSENSFQFSENVSGNRSSRTNIPSQNSGGKNKIYPSRSRKRERENYGV